MTNVVQLRSKRVFSTFPIGAKRKNTLRIEFHDVRQPGFLPLLEKPTQNGGMKPTSWNSIPMVLFRFAPMGKVEKTRFERNWTTFVNPLFALLGKAHSKWWYETDRRPNCDPKGVFSTFAPIGAKVEKTRFESQLDDVRFHTTAFCPGLGKAQGEMPWYETDRRGIAILRVFFRLSPIDGRKSKKRVLNRNTTTFGFIPRLFALGLEKPRAKCRGMKPTVVELRS